MSAIKKKGVSGLRRRPNRSVMGDAGVWLLLILVAVMMAFPLVFAVSSALKPLDELFQIGRAHV